MKTENIKPKLIILSDLWGKEKSFWVDYYTKLLEEKFMLKYYDCCELGEIKKYEYSENNLHKQFMNGGIAKAIENLKAIEKTEVYVLAFSIGGLICWKASLTGLKTRGIFAISSTRLRYETEKPSGIIELIYGEKDEFQPENEWFQNLNISKKFVKNENHNFYQKQEHAKNITDLIISYL